MNAYRRESILRFYILGFICLLIFLRGSLYWPRWLTIDSLTSPAWQLLGAWSILTLAISYMLIKDGSGHPFLKIFLKQRTLIIFVIFCMLSILWSVSPGASEYRVLLLIFATLTGAYLGFQYDPDRILNILFWFGIATVTLCYMAILYNPSLAIMNFIPYNGAWRGIFWHRNYLGQIMALFNVLFLILAIDKFKSSKNLSYLAGIFYILSLVLIVKAKSAAGYIICILLHGSVVLSIIWIRLSSLLKPAHYFTGFIVIAIAAITVFLNLDVLLGLFNRNPSLTGRVPLWGELLDVIQQRPWFGYGFGAIWTIEEFRTSLQQTLGWLYPVVIADNGFLDILLHVGVIGFALFLTIWLLTWIRSFQHILQHRRLSDFFPLIFMLFTLLGNISFSFFMETESFIWMTLVAFLIALKPVKEKILRGI